MTMSKKVLPPLHPGEVLREEFMEPLGLSVSDMAEALDVAPRLIAQVVSEKAKVTANLALRLSRCFGMSPDVWIGMQADYDLETAKERQAEEIERTVKVREDLRATA